jgi:uncharacterized protein
MSHIQASAIPLRILASGDTLHLKKFVIQGSCEQAPSVYIQAAVHGAEVQGYLVVLWLLRFFEQHPPYGTVTLVPMANPDGINGKLGDYTLGRFDLTTGDNWNRCYQDVPLPTVLPTTREGFKHYLKHYLLSCLEKPLAFSKKLNISLQVLASQADIVLDLHCDTHSVQHVYSLEHRIRQALALQWPHVIAIPAIFAGALDEAIWMPWVRLQKHLPQWQGVDAFTIELGNETTLCETSARLDAQRILRFLHNMHVCAGSIPHTTEVFPAVTPLKNMHTLYAPIGGLLKYHNTLDVWHPPHTPLFLISGLQTTPPWETTHVVSYPEPALLLSCTTTTNVHEGMLLGKIILK